MDSPALEQLLRLVENLRPTGEIGDGMVAQLRDLAARVRNAAMTPKQAAALLMMKRSVAFHGGNKADIRLTPGEGLTVGIYRWKPDGAHEAQVGWDASNAEEAAAERDRVFRTQEGYRLLTSQTYRRVSEVDIFEGFPDPFTDQANGLPLDGQ